MAEKTPSRNYEKTLARKKRGRPKSRAAGESWMIKRLAKLAGPADAKLVREAAAAGLNSREVGAMGVALWAQLQKASLDMEPHHFFGSAIKLVDVLRKLLELQAIESAEVPGQMIIDVTAPEKANDSPPDMGDEIPLS